MPRSLPAQPTARAAAPADVWARYRDNLARHLIGIARDLQIRLMNHLVADRGHRDLRPSFGLPISLIARAPRPLSELARTLAISPQAASQLVMLAERAGYLERRESPGDRRARVAALTSAGERLVRDAVAYLRELEAEQAERVDLDDHRRFVAALAILCEANGGSAKPGGGEKSIGVLPIVAAKIEQQLMHATGERGHAGLKLSHSPILTLIGPSGVRLHQLAELHRVSRQAISATAQDLETLGYLCREPDPRDRRGVIVRLTPRGTRLIEDSVAALDALDRRFEQQLAPGEFAILTRVARKLYAALEFETDILSNAFPLASAGAGGAAVPTDGAVRAALPAVGANAAAAAVAASPSPDLLRLAARLRDRLGSHDAAQLAAHLTSTQ